MRKKIFSALLLSMLAFASTSTLVSCKDYDDDISANTTAINDLKGKLSELQTNLSNQLSTLQGQLTTAKSELQAAIDKKADKTTVETLTGRVSTLETNVGKIETKLKSLEETLATKADKSDLDAKYSALTGEIEKTNTNVATLKKAVEDNLDIQKKVNENVEKRLKALEDMLSDYPEVKAQVAANKTAIAGLDEDVNDLYKKVNAITDVVLPKVYDYYDGEINKLNEKINTVSSDVNALEVFVTKLLRSLVYMPKVYLDGIETMQYKYLQDTTLVAKAAYTTTNRQNKNVSLKAGSDYLANTLPNEPENAPSGTSIFTYGPVWGVEYHMNPLNAAVTNEDIKFNVINPDVYYYNTRSVAADVVVTSPEKNAAGVQVFKAENGILTAGIQINAAGINKINKKPTDLTENKNVYTVALQAKCKDDEYITSDYAMLLPTKTYLEALVWHKAPDYAGIANASTAAQNRIGDEIGFLSCKENKKHIWDSPQEALKDPNGPALELYYDSKEGIDLKQYVGIHAVSQLLTRAENNEYKYGAAVEWAYGADEQKTYGLTYEFNLIDYEVDGNVTHDSRYATLTDGVIVAKNVKEDGVTYENESATSVDREPLVQVLVKNNEGKVVLDGYILIHIGQKQLHVNSNINEYPAQSAEFNLCDAADVFKSDWAQFSQYVLTQHMKNMTKVDFDEQYDLELAPGETWIENQTTGEKTGKAAIYTIVGKDTVLEKSAQNVYNGLGEVLYKYNSEGTTNHAFTWTISEAELEYLTANKTQPVAVKRFIKYVGKNKAKYDVLWLELNTNLTRKNPAKYTFAEKNVNYWYAFDGKDDGLDAVVYDIEAPRDGMVIDQFIGLFSSTLKGNAANTPNTVAVKKYYFVPEAQYQTIKTQDGKTYTITPVHSTASEGTDKVYDKYQDKYANNAYKELTVADKSKVNELAKKYALDINKGIFNNNKLYAKSGADYVKIAELDQTNGKITLVKNDVTKAILNAVGYQENHANLTAELTAWVGFVTSSQCEVVDEDVDCFHLASFQRPINMEPIDNQVAIDANTNENVIYLFDLLKLYDWRGMTEGYMWDDHAWFWGYYNVKSITVDMTPTKVKTNMHVGKNATPVALNTITTQSKLAAINPTNGNKENGVVVYNAIGQCKNYNSAALNQNILDYIEAHKAEFGAIYYANNGANVTDFDVIVPITLEYEWGKFTQDIKIQITRTTGN